MSSVSRPASRLRTLLGGALLATALGLTPSAALAAPGDLVLAAPPAPVLPDDSATLVDSTLSGDGRYVATVERRTCTALPAAWDSLGECYPEQHAWRYDLLTGERVKITKGQSFPGATSQPVLSHDGSVAAWTWARFGADSDISNVFRSEPGTAKAAVPTFAPGDGYPEFIGQPSISADGNSLAVTAQMYAGSCTFRAYTWKAGTGAGAPSTQQLLNGCAEGEDDYDGGPGVLNGDTNRVTMSDDGTFAFFFSRGQLYRYDIATKTAKVIELNIPSTRVQGPIAISGNGLSIAYLTSQPTPEPGTTLWKAELTEDGVAYGFGRIAESPVTVTQLPALSHDGQKLAYNWPVNPSTGKATSGMRTYWSWTNLGRLNELASARPGTTPGSKIPFTVSTTGRGPSISADGRYVTMTPLDAKQAIPDEATPSGEHVVRLDMVGQSPILGYEDDTTAPAKPASIKVKQSGGGVTLSWPAITDPSGAVTYRIRQRPATGATQSLVGTKVQTGNSVTFKGLAAGKPYRFAVTAEDIHGNRSTATTVLFTAAGTPDPTPPTITAPAKPYVGTSEQNVIGTFEINGSDLGNVTAVMIGNQVATGLVVTSTKITGKSPKTPDAASVPVTVLGPFGATAAGRFYYRPPGTTETGD